MRQEFPNERLIPFLGGLVLGGVGGAVAEGNKFNYNGYYSQPYYQYPTYPYAYYQQPLPYPQYNFPYNNSIISGKIINEEPMPIIINQDERNVLDLSYVPKYQA